MKLLSLQLITQDRTVFESTDILSLTLPTTTGEIQVLPGHASLISELTSGEFKAELAGGEARYIHVAGGFLNVLLGNKILVLADSAEHPEDMDLAAIEAARAKAEAEIAESRLSSEDYAAVMASLERNLSRIKFYHKHVRKSHQIHID